MRFNYGPIHIVTNSVHLRDLHVMVLVFCCVYVCQDLF